MYWRHELAHTHHGDCYLQMTLLCVHTAESSVEVEKRIREIDKSAGRKRTKNKQGENQLPEAQTLPSCNYLFKKTITNSRFIQLLGLNHISRRKMRERCDKQDYTWVE